MENERANVAIKNQKAAEVALAKAKVSQATRSRIPVGPEPIRYGFRSASGFRKNRSSRREDNERPATVPLVRDGIPRKHHRERQEPVTVGSRLEEEFASTDYWDRMGAEIEIEERLAAKSNGDMTPISPGKKRIYHRSKGRERILDLEGRPEGIFGSGGHRSGPQEVLARPTPFQRWKAERGIVSPGVTEILGNLTV